MQSSACDTRTGTWPCLSALKRESTWQVPPNFVHWLLSVSVSKNSHPLIGIPNVRLRAMCCKWEVMRSSYISFVVAICCLDDSLAYGPVFKLTKSHSETGIELSVGNTDKKIHEPLRVTLLDVLLFMGTNTATDRSDDILFWNAFF